MDKNKLIDIKSYFYDVTIEPPKQGQAWEDVNRIFSKNLIDKARQSFLLGEGETTYVEDVVVFFSGGIKGKLFQNYVRYALNSLYRGAKMVRDIIEDDMVINRYLDVGCAYGGCPVAMAETHARECVGLEYDARLLVLANKLAKEKKLAHRVSFHNYDITKYDDVCNLGRFDLITCIDVLEHVLQPEAAIISLVKLMGKNSVLKVDIPNMYSFQQINSDPHHHLFGSILLSRPDAIKVFESEFPGNKRYTVGYFYPLEWYIDKFKNMGIFVEVMDKVIVSDDELLRTQTEMYRLFETLSKKVEEEKWPKWRVDLISDHVNRMISQVKIDANSVKAGNLNSVAFQLRYSVPVHHLRCTNS